VASYVRDFKSHFNLFTPFNIQGANVASYYTLLHRVVQQSFMLAVWLQCSGKLYQTITNILHKYPTIKPKEKSDKF